MILQFKTPISESINESVKDPYSDCNTFMEAALKSISEVEENWRRFDKYLSENHIIIDENHIEFLSESGITITYEEAEIHMITEGVGSVLQSWVNKVKSVIGKAKDRVTALTNDVEKMNRLEGKVQEIKWPEGKTISSRDLNSVKPFKFNLITEEINQKGLKSFIKWNGAEWVITNNNIIKKHVKQWTGKDTDSCTVADIVNYHMAGKETKIDITGSTKGYSYKEAKAIVMNMKNEGNDITKIENSVTAYSEKIKSELENLTKDAKGSDNKNIGKIQEFLKNAALMDMNMVYAVLDLWIGRYMLNKQVCFTYLSGPKKK